ncbi:MAG: hypothetical protein FWF29_08565, partial [Treponema sp.]|nr:hypothetical protein [Treponema sp.]
NINQFVFKQLTATTDGGAAPLLTGLPSSAGLDCNVAWKWTRCFDDWQYYAYNMPDGLSKSFLADNAWRVIKFKIPKANIGITSAGQKVRVFAAMSEGFDSDHTIFVRGFIPRAAAPDAVDNGESMDINMANALEYTF